MAAKKAAQKGKAPAGTRSSRGKVVRAVGAKASRATP